VSWGAIWAGLFVSLTVYVLLGVLGAALGLSFIDQLQGNAGAFWAGLWVTATLLISLFCGGCTITTCTVGETKSEAVIYGVILWGMMFMVIVWLSGSALRTGFGGALSAAKVGVASGNPGANWEQAAREAGVTPEQVDRMRKSEAWAVSTGATWWVFAGLLISLGASITGALAGSGPNPTLRNVLFRQTVVQAVHQGTPTATP
jgi:hypothetical protein